MRSSIRGSLQATLKTMQAADGKPDALCSFQLAQRARNVCGDLAGENQPSPAQHAQSGNRRRF